MPDRSRPVPTFHVCLIFCLGLFFIGPAEAQLPTASLKTVWPCAMEAGTSMDVVVEGDFLDEARELRFSDARITAAVKTGEPLPGETEASILYGEFTVTVPQEVTDSLVDMWVVGRYGISNPRRVIIQQRGVSVFNDARFDLGQAKVISDAETVLARCSGQQVDHYKIQLEAGTRLLVRCQALEIDSMLVAGLVLCDAGDGELIRTRGTRSADAILSYDVSTSGIYYLKVHDVLFRGGNPFFYCLQIERGSAESPVNETPSIEADARLAWRPTADASEFLTSLEGARRVAAADLPSDVGFSVSPPESIAASFKGGGKSTVDFDFDAKAGETWHIEVVSADAGAATDPEMQIGRLRPQPEESFKFERLHHIDDVTELPGSLLGQTYKDPKHRFAVPEDGRYRVVLRDLQTTSDPSWDKSFRLVMRPADPDFQLLVLLPHPTLDPARSTPTGTLIRRGDRLAIEVAVKPIDGFFEPLRARASLASGQLTVTQEIAWQWPVEVTLVGLPVGLTAKPVTLDNTNRRSHIVVEASEDVTAWAGEVNVVGTIQLPPEFGGQSLKRNARCKVIQLADPDGRGLAVVRSGDGLRLATTNLEAAPIKISLGSDVSVLSGKVGANLEIPLVLTRTESAKGKVTVRAAGLPPNMTAAEIGLEGETLTANLTLNIPANVAIGTYQIFVNAETELPWPRNPEVLARTEQRLRVLKQKLEVAGEAEKEMLAQHVADAEVQVNQLKESTKPQNARVFIPSNTVTVQIVPAE